MQEQTKSDLIFIPSPGRGHLSAALEMAKLLVDRDHRLSVTVLVIKPPFDPKSTAHSYSNHFQESESRNIHFVDIPPIEYSPTTNFFQITHIIDSHKSHVRAEVAKIAQASGSNRKLVGFVVDMFCIGMTDVANEFNVPTYVFFTSGAAMLGLMLHFQGLEDYHDQDMTVFLNSVNEISTPSYELPIPVKSLPPFLMDKTGRQAIMDLSRRFRETRGILVNTFRELELPAMRFFSDNEKFPPVYSVGPILSEDSKRPEYDEIMEWLDRQPDSSVVFLCFGSRGCFDEVQVKEIASNWFWPSLDGEIWMDIAFIIWKGKEEDMDGYTPFFFLPFLYVTKI